jgi:type I restriction enzyme S subunit
VKARAPVGSAEAVPLRKLGDLFTFKNGRAFKKEEWSDSGTPIIRIQNLNNAEAPFNYYRGEYDDDILVNEGDLLFSWSGTVGSSFGSHLWNREQGLLNQHIFKVSLCKDIDKAYAFYALKHITAAIEKAVNGAVGLVHITKEKLNEFTIPVPPLREQHRTVDILDDAFKDIALAKAKAERNLENARALLESQLQAIFAHRGSGWMYMTLSDVALKFGRGKSKHRPRGDPRLLGGEYPLIQTGDISNSDHWIVNYSQTYNEVGLAQSKLWPKGTICIAIVGANVAETAVLGFDACFPDSVIGIVVNERLANNEYVEYLLQWFKPVLKERGKGTARDNLNLGLLENQRFPFPKLVIQRAIASELNNLREETRRLESLYRQKFAALDALKQSLLHQAFTGAL